MIIQYEFHKGWFLYFSSLMAFMGLSLTGRLWHPLWAIGASLVVGGLIFLMAVGMARRNSDKVISNRTYLMVLSFTFGGIPFLVDGFLQGDFPRRSSLLIEIGPVLAIALFATWLIYDFIAARKRLQPVDAA